jgi:hypothetical protein
VFRIYVAAAQHKAPNSPPEFVLYQWLELKMRRIQGFGATQQKIRAWG